MQSITRDSKNDVSKPSAKSSSQPVEELLFKSESAFLCLLVNHRNKGIRVIDFRAGALPAKRMYIQKVAQQEGIEKVITLVEKDEVVIMDSNRFSPAKARFLGSTSEATATFAAAFWIRRRASRLKKVRS